MSNSLAWPSACQDARACLLCCPWEQRSRWPVERVGSPVTSACVRAGLLCVQHWARASASLAWASGLGLPAGPASRWEPTPPGPPGAHAGAWSPGAKASVLPGDRVAACGLRVAHCLRILACYDTVATGLRTHAVCIPVLHTHPHVCGVGVFARMPGSDTTHSVAAASIAGNAHGLCAVFTHLR